MSKTARDVISDVAVCADDLSCLGDWNADNILIALDTAGFVIVPKEPTPEMRDAGMMFIGGDITTIEASQIAKDCYVAMLAAKDQTHISQGI
jgi:hypothetical protein